MDLDLLDLRLLLQLIQAELSFLDLYVITKEEHHRELEKCEKINEDFEGFLSYPQTPGPEGRMLEDQDIQIIFIHMESPLGPLRTES